MKTNKLLPLFLVSMFSSVIINNCASLASTATPVPEPSKTLSPVLIEPTATFYIPTVVPTLLPEQEKRLAEVLQSAKCILPCYLGIIPGKTSLQEARVTLESLGGRYMGLFQRNKTDGAFLYTYQFHIGNPDSEAILAYADVTLVSDGNLVQILETAPSTGRLTLEDQSSLEIYQQYWRRYYTVEQIFLQLGESEQLYIVDGLSDELIMSYGNPNAKIIISGTAKENNLCPKDRLVHYLLTSITISNKNSPFSIDGAGEAPLTDHEIYFPIEEIFGITTHEFFESVLTNPEVCFESKTLKP